MKIWEKAVLNIQKGVRRATVFAATFAERVRAEVGIVRLRIRIDEVRTRMEDLYGSIGKRMVALQKQDVFPRTGELLLKDEIIVAAMVELADREQELGELQNEIRNIQADVQTVVKHTEDHIA